MLNSQTIAIIPARSGSKGVPGKNIALFGSHPLIAYSIAVAKLIGIKRVIVSTDSSEYAAIARHYGAETPFLRPPELSSDQSGDFEFMHHAMEWFQKNESTPPEFWLHLRPTTPLREPNILKTAIRDIENRPEATSLRSGHEAPESPLKWFLRDKNNYFVGLKEDLTPEKVNLPRQQFPPVYVPDGYVDIVRYSYVIGHQTLHGDRMLVFESPMCTEVDTKSDFDYLEYQLEQNGSPLLKYLNHFN